MNKVRLLIIVFLISCNNKNSDVFHLSNIQLIDTTSIYRNDYGLLITTVFDRNDSCNKHGAFYLLKKRKEEWQIIDSLPYNFLKYFDTSPYKIKVSFKDINYDKINDIFVLKGISGGDSKEYYDLLLTDTVRNKLTLIKYHDEIINPYYDEKNNCFYISSLEDTDSSKSYKLIADSLVNYQIN